jgi:type 1 glutamine amidotransferase
MRKKPVLDDRAACHYVSWRGGHVYGGLNSAPSATILGVSMIRYLGLTLALALGLASLAAAGEAKIKILLVGKDRDHPFGTHEYMTDCEILAKCLRQTPGIEAVVSNGWPKDPNLLKDVKAIVLHTRNGGNVLFDPLVRKEAEALLNNGAGLTALHWSTGADKKAGDDWLRTLGGWFGTDFSKLHTGVAPLLQTEPGHPICNGWKPYKLRDEYYLHLKFAEGIKPILKAEIDQKEHTVAWVHERPGSKGGRSFSFVCGHFHENFGLQPFRQAIVNGILWTAHIEVPAGGAPCAITAKDMELPPDTRKK